MTEANITQILLNSLRGQAARFPTEARDIEIAVAALELRRAVRADEPPEGTGRLAVNPRR